MRTPRWVAAGYAAVALVAGAHAAQPEFKISIVLESRVYERESGSISVGGIRTARSTASTSRVTVALDGMRITGEWEPKTTTISTTARDFPRGSDVPAAVERNRLLLKAPDGSVVTAKIVRREKQPDDESRRDSSE
jgi:hypothetical protein